MAGRAFFRIIMAFAAFVLLSGAAYPAHFPDPAPTPQYVFLYGIPKVNGAPLQAGDEVAAYSVHPKPATSGKWQKTLAGHAVIDADGQLNLMPVYGDDPSTDNVVEGCAAGEEIQLVLWRASEGREYTAYLSSAGAPVSVAWTTDRDAIAVDLDFTEGQRVPLRNDAWNLVGYGVLKGYHSGASPPASPQLPGIDWDNVSSLGDAVPLKSIEGKYVRVIGDDGNGARFWHPALPGMSTLSYLAPGYGYWVKMKPSAQRLSWMTVPGVRTAGAESLALDPGWTLCGDWEADDVYRLNSYDASAELLPVDATGDVPFATVAEMFASVSGCVSRVSTFDGSGAKMWISSLPQFSTLKYLAPGYGYWIRMDCAGTLAPPGTAPVIDGITPSEGFVGSVVTITGSHFTTSPTVRFNGTAAAVSSATDTQIVAVVPAGATTGPITVTTPAGTATSGSSFTVQVPSTGWPEDFESYPADGFPSPAWTYSGNADIHVDNTIHVSGSQSVRLLGELAGCWGALLHRPLNVSPPYTIEVLVRNGAEGLTGCHPSRADIKITTGPSWVEPARLLVAFDNNGTLKGSATNNSDYLNATVLGSYPLNQWVKVKIGYEAVDGATVRLSYWANDVFLHSETLPSFAYEGQVAYLGLSVGEGTVWFDDVNVVPGISPFPTAPAISGFAPASGYVGTPVTIDGRNFGTSPEVRFNGVAATVSSATGTRIVAVVPPGATTGPITVTTPAGTATSGMSFTVGGVNLVDGDILVVEMGLLGEDGRVIRVDSTTGAQSVLSSGGYLINPKRIAVGPDGYAYVTNDNAAVVGSQGASIIRIDPTSGAQTVVASGGYLTDPGGIAIDANGIIFTTDSVPGEGPVMVRIDPGDGSQTVVPASGYDIAFGWQGDLYATTGNLGTAINRFDPVTWSATAVTSSDGNYFGALAVEKNGNLLAAIDNPALQGAPLSIWRVDPVTGNKALVSDNSLLLEGFAGSSSYTDLAAGNDNYIYASKLAGAQWSGLPCTRASCNARLFKIDPLSGVPVILTSDLANPGGIAVYAGPVSSPAPVIFGFTPPNGIVGSSVIVAGRNFGISPTVRFNGVTASVSSAVDNQVVAVVPAGATTGPITVTTAEGTATSGTSFTVQVPSTGWPEDFESYPAEGFPSPAWTYSGNADIHVDNTIHVSGTRSVRLLGELAACWGALLHHPLNVSPPYTIEVQVRNGTETLTGCHPNRGMIALNTAPDWTSSARQMFAFTDNGTLTGSSGPSDLLIGTVLGWYPLNEWVKVKVGYEVVDASTVRISYWANDAFLASETLPSFAYEGQLTYLSLLVGEGTAWFDDVNVTPGVPAVPAAPAISGFAPASGFVGTPVTIDGSNFAASPEVRFNGVVAVVSSATDTRIVAYAPADATSGPITVTTPAGTATSGTSFTVVSPAGNYALSFDGGDRIAVPDSPSLNPSQVTVEAWVKLNALVSPGNQFLVAKGNDQTQGSYYLSANGDQFHFYVGANGVDQAYAATPSMLEAGRTYHVAGSYDGSNVRVYVNGVLQGTTPAAVATGNAGVLTLGYHDLAGWEYLLNGILDEVRIWNTARSQAEIQGAMYQVLSGSEAGLVAYWRMDEGAGQVAHDFSGHGNNGRLGSTTGIDADDPTWVARDLTRYTITGSVPAGHGTVSCESPVFAHESSRCTISADPGYRLGAFSDNGTSVLGSVVDNTYRITDVMSNHVVEATFAEDIPVITSGETLSRTIGSPDFRNTFQFTGSAGERVVINAVTTSGALDTEILLYPPGGGPAEGSTNQGILGGGDQMDRQLLQSGTYTIVIQDHGLNDAGSYNLTFLKMPPGDPSGAAVTSGQTLNRTINGPSDLEGFTFTGSAGERVVINAVTTSGTLDTEILLYPPGGGPAEASTNQGILGGGDQMDRQLLQSGTYTIVIQDHGLNDAGSYNLTFSVNP